MGNLSPDDNDNSDQPDMFNVVETGSSDHNTANNLEEATFLFEKEEQNGLGVVVQPEIQDRFFLVYIILLIHGITILMPWNMFLNANDYFVNYKLNETLPNGTLSQGMNTYQNYFLSNYGFAAQAPNVLSSGLNLICQFKRDSPIRRIVVCVIVIIIMFILTVVLAMIDSSSWSVTFFWITMVTVVVINSARGTYSGSVYGIAACLPSKYTNAVIQGSNISGLVTSILALIAAAATPDRRISAIYYFLVAIVVLLVGFDTCLVLPLLPFYTQHFRKISEGKESSGEDEESYLTKYLIVIKKCWLHLFNVFFVYFVTLTCFPAIVAGIKSVNDIISERFFSLVTCFLFFNLFSVVGSLAKEFIQKPNPRYVWIPVMLRLLFIPFFLLCNFRPDQRNIPVIFGNDYVYCVGSILLALTSGYFSSICMMYVSSTVEDKYKATAGAMGAFCLLFGVFCGIVFTFPLIYAIERNGGILPANETTLDQPFNNSTLESTDMLTFS